MRRGGGGGGYLYFRHAPWNVSWGQLFVTWPGSLCSEFQTGSSGGASWRNSFGRSMLGCISAASWRRCRAIGRASPPTADTAPLSRRSNTHTHTHINLSFTVVIYYAWFIWPYFAHVLWRELTLLTPSWYEPLLTGQSLWSMTTQFSPSAGGGSFRQSRALYLCVPTMTNPIWILE